MNFVCFFFLFSGKLDDIVLGFDSIDDYKVKLMNLLTFLGLLVFFFNYVIDVFTLSIFIISYFFYLNMLYFSFYNDWISTLQNDTTYFGAIVGRVANRIGRAQFTLDGTDYKLVPNDGRNMLHGAYMLIHCLINLFIYLEFFIILLL